MNCHGDDVTAQYVEGAYQAWRMACEHKVVLAIMKEFSPSCGTHTVHNGRFDSQYVSGRGVTTALLTSKGIKVFSDNQLSEAQQYYQSMVGFIY
jgi:uncharacterized protein YbbK (DUF523 family)